MKLTHLAVSLVITLSTSFQASAVTQSRSTSQMAVNSCHAARPTFETSLRSRPLAIVNEGTETVFISCAMPIDGSINQGATSMLFEFFNRGAAATVSCTAVGDSGAQTMTHSSAVMNTGRLGVVNFSNLNPSSAIAVDAAVSCTLPPGMEIRKTFFQEDIDVGQ